MATHLFTIRGETATGAIENNIRAHTSEEARLIYRDLHPLYKPDRIYSTKHPDSREA